VAIEIMFDHHRLSITKPISIAGDFFCYTTYDCGDKNYRFKLFFGKNLIFQLKIVKFKKFLGL
jgi:hypothetical protein